LISVFTRSPKLELLQDDDGYFLVRHNYLKINQAILTKHSMTRIDN